MKILGAVETRYFKMLGNSRRSGMAESIRALSWNVNGLRAVHKKGFLEWFSKESPEILCLQETKAQEDQLPDPLRNIAGYQSYFSSGVRKGLSGVALYTRTEPVEVSYGFGIEKFDTEGRIIVADYGEFVLLNIYFPNGRSSAERLTYKMEFYDAFLEFVDRLTGQGKSVVVCGDYNTAHKEIDLARPKANEKVSGFLPEERAWMDKLVGHGYVDTFRMYSQQPEQYTYWDMMTRARDRNVGWRIDYFFASETFSSRISGAHIYPDVMGSDHCPVGVDIS